MLKNIKKIFLFIGHLNILIFLSSISSNNLPPLVNIAEKPFCLDI